MLVQQAAEQGSAAAMRALPNLLAGRKEPLKFASRVNPERFAVSICTAASGYGYSNRRLSLLGAVGATSCCVPGVSGC